MWSINDRALIFCMHDPCVKPFPLIPCCEFDLDLWPTSRSKFLPGGGPQFSEFACFTLTCPTSRMNCNKTKSVASRRTLINCIMLIVLMFKYCRRCHCYDCQLLPTLWIVLIVFSCRRCKLLSSLLIVQIVHCCRRCSAIWLYSVADAVNCSDCSLCRRCQMFWLSIVAAIVNCCRRC